MKAVTAGDSRCHTRTSVYLIWGFAHPSPLDMRALRGWTLRRSTTATPSAPLGSSVCRDTAFHFRWLLSQKKVPDFSQRRLRCRCCRIQKYCSNTNEYDGIENYENTEIVPVGTSDEKVQQQDFLYLPNTA